MTIVAGVVVLAGCGGEPEPEPKAERFMVLPPLAGVSWKKEITVSPARAGDFGGDTLGALWNRFNHRCASCHVLPSPTQHRPEEWEGVVRRMGGHFEEAGLLPLSEEDRDGITELLRKRAVPKAAASERSESGG